MPETPSLATLTAASVLAERAVIRLTERVAMLEQANACVEALLTALATKRRETPQGVAWTLAGCPDEVLAALTPTERRALRTRRNFARGYEGWRARLAQAYTRLWHTATQQGQQFPSQRLVAQQALARATKEAERLRTQVTAEELAAAVYDISPAPRDMRTCMDVYAECYLEIRYKLLTLLGWDACEPPNFDLAIMQHVVGLVAVQLGQDLRTLSEDALRPAMGRVEQLALAVAQRALAEEDASVTAGGHPAAVEEASARVARLFAQVEASETP